MEKSLDLKMSGVMELGREELKEVDGGGERWSEKIGEWVGYWLSSYAQEESLGAFVL